MDYYQAKVDAVNQKRLLEKNSTMILVWWDKRFDSKTHPFMEKSVWGFKINKSFIFGLEWSQGLSYFQVRNPSKRQIVVIAISQMTGRLRRKPMVY